MKQTHPNTDTSAAQSIESFQFSTIGANMAHATREVDPGNTFANFAEYASTHVVSKTKKVNGWSPTLFDDAGCGVVRITSRYLTRAGTETTTPPSKWVALCSI
jgi:hypothetical protein